MPGGAHPGAEVDVLAVEEEVLVEPADRLERLAADEHAGAGDPVGRAGARRRRPGRGRARRSSSPGGQTRCRKSACAKVERRRGKRRWLKASEPSSSRMRGAASRDGRAPASSTRASASRSSALDAGVGVEQEDVRRAGPPRPRGCSPPRSRRCGPRGRACIGRPADRCERSRRARRCPPRSPSPGRSAPGARRTRAACGALL